MKKIIDFLKLSNRWKHLIGGIVVYIIARIISNEEGALCSVYSSALSLELKDKMYGNKIDAIDIACTVAIPTLCYGIEKIIKLVMN